MFFDLVTKEMNKTNKKMEIERSHMENYLFEKMPVPKAYMKLALPVVLSMIVSLVYNMVDTYFI